MHWTRQEQLPALGAPTPELDRVSVGSGVTRSQIKMQGTFRGGEQGVEATRVELCCPLCPQGSRASWWAGSSSRIPCAASTAI